MDLRDYNIETPVAYEDAFEKYAGLILSYNKKTNLTSVTDADEIDYVHFLDSALILSGETYDETDERRVLDVGTGAGFPGMVIAILRPEWRITLLDSLNKRTRFLESVVEELGLDNVEVICSRAEDAARVKSLRASFDIVTSRAVAELRLLLELCIPFVNSEGKFISYKGPKYEVELEAADNSMSELNCSLLRTREYDVLDRKRFLLEFLRTGELSDRYPRRSGIPAKRPL